MLTTVGYQLVELLVVIK